MAILNLTQAGRELGFKTAEPLRRMLKHGVLSDYLRAGPDARAKYLETHPRGLPTLKQQVQAHTQCHFSSPLWRHNLPANDWSTRANEYLDHSRWSSPPWTREQWITLRNVIEMAVD